ncbi:MAG: hypothetical protein ACOX7W_03095 [Christensenellales bacterium]
MVRQLSVFLENTKGRLAHMTRVLGEAGVDLLALSIADTTNFGILRAIVDDNEKALASLRAAGYTVNLTEVLAVTVPDKPGGLAEVLEMLLDGGVNVEYLYSFVRNPKEYALILFKLDDVAAARNILESRDVRILQQEDLYDLK